MKKISTSVQDLVANGYLSQEKATHFLTAIEKEHFGLDDAFEQIRQLVDEKVALRGDPPKKVVCTERSRRAITHGRQRLIPMPNGTA